LPKVPFWQTLNCPLPKVTFLANIALPIAKGALFGKHCIAPLANNFSTSYLLYWCQKHC
jgi:hypothetical protein